VHPCCVVLLPPPRQLEPFLPGFPCWLLRQEQVALQTASILSLSPHHPEHGCSLLTLFWRLKQTAQLAGTRRYTTRGKRHLFPPAGQRNDYVYRGRNTISTQHSALSTQHSAAATRPGERTCMWTRESHFLSLPTLVIRIAPPLGAGLTIDSFPNSSPNIIIVQP
jgi:hypothetical protein